MGIVVFEEESSKDFPAEVVAAGDESLPSSSVLSLLSSPPPGEEFNLRKTSISTAAWRV